MEHRSHSTDASLSLGKAARRPWDAVVIGAGPAGSVAALQLARQRLAVLLVDKAAFPRWKVCGCCLNRRSLGVIESLGLGRLPAELGAVPLSEFRLATANREARMPLPGGAAVSRTAFDAALVRAAAAAGAAFLPATLASPGLLNQQFRQVVLRNHTHPLTPSLSPEAGEREKNFRNHTPLSPLGRGDGGEGMPGRGGHALTPTADCEISARVVIVANGLSGGFLARDQEHHAAVEADSRLGAGAVADQAPGFYEPGTIYMACGGGGYVGLVRLEDGRLDVAAALDPLRVRRAGGLGQAAAAVLSEAGFPEIHNLAELAWRGTPLLRRRSLRLGMERMFLVGDAARFVEPFTGDGIAWALASGAAVVPLAVRACRSWDPLLIPAWGARYRSTVARRQRLCRIVGEALRRPALVRGFVCVLQYVPLLAAPLIAYLNGSWQPRRSS